MNIARTPLKKYCLSAFILVYVYSALVLAWPWPASEGTEVKLLGPLTSVLDTLGLWHRLRLFAPVPPMDTGDVRFEVDFADGSSTIWKYPRDVLAWGDPPGSYNRYLFYYVIWGCDKNQKAEIMLPELARYIASRCNHPSPPANVKIIESWAHIPPIEEGVGLPLIHPSGRESVLLDYNVATGRSTFGEFAVGW